METCLIILDAQTLNILDDEYLVSSIVDSSIATKYVFLFDEIELSSKRDTKELYAEA